MGSTSVSSLPADASAITNAGKNTNNLQLAQPKRYLVDLTDGQGDQTNSSSTSSEIKRRRTPKQKHNDDAEQRCIEKLESKAIKMAKQK